MTELKLCPFCGGEAEIHEDLAQTKDPIYAFVCKKCGALVYMDELIDKQDSIEAWNNRPSHWHTGKPTEEGWYLLKIKSDDEIIYDTDKLIQCLWGLDWKYAHQGQKILAWQKINEGEN